MKITTTAIVANIIYDNVDRLKIVIGSGVFDIIYFRVTKCVVIGQFVHVHAILVYFRSWFIDLG